MTFYFLACSRGLESAWSLLPDLYYTPCCSMFLCCTILSCIIIFFHLQSSECDLSRPCFILLDSSNQVCSYVTLGSTPTGAVDVMRQNNQCNCHQASPGPAALKLRLN